MIPNGRQKSLHAALQLYRNVRNFCVLALVANLCVAGAMAYDVEVDSVDNKVYILLINDNPGDSYETITISSDLPGFVTSASGCICPASGSVPAAPGSDLAAIDFTVSPTAALGASGNLYATVSGFVGAQEVDIVLKVPLTVVASAPVAQGIVGSTEPVANPPGAVDSDGDGVSDALETAFGSNPNSASSLPGDPVVEANVPLLGAVGAALLALLLFGTGAASARRRNAGLLALTAVLFLPLDLMAGSATRIQLVAHIPVPPPPPPPPQLLSATALASSTQGAEGGGPASSAVDGNMATRWGSQINIDPSWITLDLGSAYALSEVIIHWEAANAATYQIQGSNDVNGSGDCHNGTGNWTTLSSESGGTFGDRTDIVDLTAVTGTYQCVRMYGITRSPNNSWGYSIWEMEVWGLSPADEDGDGVDDSVDQCPSTPAGATVLANGCEDSDNDGVDDSADLCSNTPAGSTVDAYGCAIVDSDNDGVPDGQDQCPNTPAGATVDNTGCEFIVPVNEVASINGILAGGSGSSQPGYTLYVFDNDLAAPGTSTCNGGCATSWPPLLVNDGVASGVSDLGTIVRNDSTVQATHNGRPLYFYIGDSAAGQTNGDQPTGAWHMVPYVQLYTPLFDATTPLEPETAYVRSSDGVVVTRFGDRGRDRHAKDIGYYDPNNIYNSDHYDHYLANYWAFRTARIQFEDHVPNGTSRIDVTFITEWELGAREFRVWYWGDKTTGEFHFNPQKEEEKVNPNEPGVVYVGQGEWNDDFIKTSETGNQHMYTLAIDKKWESGGQVQLPLATGMNMEFEISQFLLGPPLGSRVNYYGTSFVYVIGQPGLAPFEWQRGVNNPGGSNDGTPIPPVGLLGGKGTLGYNYSEEPAGRFMQMATNLSHINAQSFVEGRRVHHTNFIDGSHDERNDNAIWTAQVGKAGNHYINSSCANCHVRNGRALVADVGSTLDKWVFKVGDMNGDPDPSIGSVLQPNQTGSGAEGTVTLGAWTDLANGLRSPNYDFSFSPAPARFSARIAPQLVGIGLLEAVPESEILAWEDPNDSNSDGISGRASAVIDPVSGVSRLGRFGYKASTSSVEHQVAAALNTDIGVMTSILPNPDCGSAQTTCGASGSELADTEVDKLAKYISLLGVGARRDYAVTEGETVFNNAGCESCHRNTLTTSQYHPLTELRNQTIHPYTDMLLHDMGAGLADNHGEGSANGAEWRTAPLWGLGHTVSVMIADAKANDTVSQARDPNDINRIGYLHDGRARTIDEAIRWHGGEAEAAKNAYEALTQTDKDALIAFLNSL